jgi:hypothetical protein
VISKLLYKLNIVIIAIYLQEEKMKKLVCLVMIVSLFTIIFATPVSLADVQTAAVNWMVHLTGESEAISNYVTETDSLGTPLLHRIDFIDGGYVIATANDLVYPILGYSACVSVLENS